MRPWERRLRDLAQLLSNCGGTYFSPERFRQNTNQFLQTARTVTFIIQKNKATIPDFDVWYGANVLQPWMTDPVMSWAKDARNVIEKEGDLEMQSTLRVAVLYSYISEEDLVLEIGRKELLQADIDQLIKAAGRILPAGVADAAVLKIQRRWIANSLPDRELIYALTYAYSELHRVCRDLATHIGSALDASVPHPTSLDPSSNDVAKVRFVKFAEPGIGRHASVRVDRDPDFKAPPAFVALKEELRLAPKPECLADVVAMHAKLAQATFEHHGNHIPMLVLYDKTWKQIDYLSTAFTDQAEKYLFWRNVADRAFYLRAFAMVWTSESWVRDISEGTDRPIRELPIIGEQLHVVGADASNRCEIISWEIQRPNGTGTALLTRLSPDDPRQAGHFNFTKPVVAAMKMAHSSDVS
jgi:hypothetical protein